MPLVSVLLIAIFVQGTALARPALSAPPTLLFVMVDDLRAQLGGAYGQTNWMNSTGQSPAASAIPGGRGCVTTPDCVACLVAHNATNGNAVTPAPCPDSCYVDNMIATYTAQRLADFANSQTRFAFFAGFKRPHLGFQLPQHAFDAYSPDQAIAVSREPPPDYPATGWWRNKETDGLPDVKQFVIKMTHSRAC